MGLKPFHLSNLPGIFKEFPGGALDLDKGPDAEEVQDGETAGRAGKACRGKSVIGAGAIITQDLRRL